MKFGPSLESRQGERRALRIAALLALLVPFSSVPAAAREVSPPPDHMIAIGPSAELPGVFEYFGYDLAPVRRGEGSVVPLFFSSLPADFDRVESIPERKVHFLRILLPLILRQNFRILCQRAKLLRLKSRHGDGAPLTEDDIAWIDGLLIRYTLADNTDPPSDISAKMELLSRRVDRVPVAMALAQAIEESGWGTSRFARRGNAVFGQRTYDGTGIVPREIAPSDDTADFKVRSFPSLQASVASYMHNLNTYPHYRAFRDRRARIGEGDVKALIATLTFYSERRADYIRTIEAILDSNRLQDFQAASFPADTLRCRDGNQGG